jgi:serine/threonine-protein kinase ULK/ATG1
MDYCNGGNLREYLKKKNKKLSEQEAVTFLRQLCQGYRVLYEQKIIHRDIKPENIMLSDGILKLGDFGFARVVIILVLNNFSFVFK